MRLCLHEYFNILVNEIVGYFGSKDQSKMQTHSVN